MGRSLELAPEGELVTKVLGGPEVDLERQGTDEADAFDQGAQAPSVLGGPPELLGQPVEQSLGGESEVLGPQAQARLGRFLQERREPPQVRARPLEFAPQGAGEGGLGRGQEQAGGRYAEFLEEAQQGGLALVDPSVPLPGRDFGGFEDAPQHLALYVLEQGG